MTYAQRDDLVAKKATEANYDRWHDIIEDEPTSTKFRGAEGRTIAEILGDVHGDEGDVHGH